MTTPRTRMLILSKLLIAAMALVGLAAMLARGLLPSLTTAELLLYAAAGVGVLLVLLILLTVVSLQFSQFILRAGGTDPQWLWFGREPRGLAGMREQRRP